MELITEFSITIPKTEIEIVKIILTDSYIHASQNSNRNKQMETKFGY